MHSVFHAFTHSVVWASVIASAFVALATTLLVEYLAKPGLEARKERILEKGREKRQAVKDVQRCVYLLPKLPFYVRAASTREISEEYINKITTELSERITEADDALMSYLPSTLYEEWAQLTIRLADYELILNKGLSPKEVQEDSDALYERLHLFYLYFISSKCAVGYRRETIARIKSTALITWVKPKPDSQNNSPSD